MRGSDLTTAQLKKLRDSLRPKVSCLARVRERMEVRQFPKTDRLYRGVLLSQEMMNDLLQEIETILSYRGFHEPPEPFK